MRSEAERHPERVRWFGPSWWAPICDLDYETDVPVGEACIFCGRLFEPDSQGVSMFGQPRTCAHIQCLLRNVGAEAHHNPFLRPDPPATRTP